MALPAEGLVPGSRLAPALSWALSLALMMVMALPGICPAQSPQTSPDHNATAPCPATASAPPAEPMPRDATARSVLDKMSLEQKVGQVFMCWFKGPAPSCLLEELLVRRHAGGIILFDSAGNIQSPAQTARLANTAQALAARGGSPGLLVAVDQEGGPVARLRRGFTVAPSNMAQAATGDASFVELSARFTASELAACGINMNLAPVLDVNTNPANPIIGTRSFGSSAAAVADSGRVAVEAYIDMGVIPVAKHFPGHGDTGTDSHTALPAAYHGLPRLLEVELAPFMRAIQAGIPAIMTAHMRLPFVEDRIIPATFSDRILGGILRQQLAFDGLIFSDSLGMGALARFGGPGEVAVRAFAAGCDVLLFGADRGHDPQEQLQAMDALLDAARSGEISMERLDASVLRILKAKERFGLLAPPKADPDQASVICGSITHREQARSVAQAGITVIRDRASVLPLNPKKPVLVVWPRAAHDPLEAVDDLGPGPTPDLAVLRLPADPDDKDMAQAMETAMGAEAVILLASRADRHPGQAALAKALADKPLAVVLLDAPYDTALYPESAAVVAAWCNAPASVRAGLRAALGLAPAPGRSPVEAP